MAHRILLVEDHTASRTTLAILLETSGYDVDTAANGREAIELLARYGYDVVVSDIQMPTMDGIELYHQIQHRWPSLARRVVFMTAHRTPDSPQTDSKGSPLPVLWKPFSVQRLREAVACALTRAA